MVEFSRFEVDALFAEALERPGPQRLAYLEEACGGNVALQAEVAELLRLAGEPVAALDGGSRCSRALLQELVEDLEHEPDLPAAGDRIGPWELERELGRGGMGTVYLARRADGEFEQRVALKFLHAGAGSEETLLRFEQERQILAALEHPNIARLIDGGRAADGRPFLVMEYVVGERIDSHCERQRLSVEERVDLFIGVARAVQSAHRSLVVHRDLKPSNILVTEDGTPKLLDFGIAKLLQPAPGREALTRTMARVLTPEYSSPEQVRGELITTASDVYQLGLLLFELLTGERAQRVDPAAAPSDIERVVCEEDTPRPSTAVTRAGSEGRAGPQRVSARSLRGDLDNIVLRALHKEPDRRYGSAAELAADLERFRHGFPVEARPDTLWYRVGRFTSRHRVGVSTALLVALLLSGSAVTSTIQQRRIRTQAEKARNATAFVTRIFTDFAEGKVGSGEASALEVVDRGVEQARLDLVDQPDLQAELLTGFGQLYQDLGRYDRAVPSLETALDIRSRRLDPMDPLIADTAMQLGNNLHYTGRLNAAEPPLRRALEIYRQAGQRAQVCRALGHLGDLLHSRGDLPAAETVLRASFGECGGPLAQRDLANVLRDRGDLEAALELYPKAVDRFLELNPNDDSGAGINYLNWGDALTLAGELEQAGRVLERTIDIWDVHYGGNHPLAAMGLRYRGRLALAQGAPVEARRLLEEALAMQTEWLGEDHAMVPRHRVDLAAVSLALGQPERALSFAEEALSRFDGLGIPDHPKALEARQIVAAAYLAGGEVEQAIPLLGELIGRQEELFVGGDPRLGASYALLAETLDRSGDPEPAARLRSRAREIFGRLPGSAALYCHTYGSSVEAVASGGCQV